MNKLCDSNALQICGLEQVLSTRSRSCSPEDNDRVDALRDDQRSFLTLCFFTPKITLYNKSQFALFCFTFLIVC